jgi:SNF2 family DNA or RNA helicase
VVTTCYLGLGKTVEAIAIDLVRRSDFGSNIRPKTLVVTPLSVIPTWIYHWQKYAPWLKISVIDNKDRDPFVKSVIDGSADVYICHWPAVRLIPELADRRWFHIIGDEIHAIQNRKAKQTVEFKKIKGDYRTGLSGTPAFDKPDDLWSIFNWLYPQFWGSYWRYVNEHLIVTEFTGYKKIIGIQNVEKLQRLMSGFYLRRRKEDVLEDLPEKYHTEIWVDLSPLQERAYESMRKTMIAWIGDHENEPVTAPVVIAQLTRLQQFSDAYAEIDENGKVRLSEPSSKLDAVMDIIDASSEPVVIFSQFSQMIDILKIRLEKAGISHGIYTGTTSMIDRARIEKDFQDGKLKVFAGTISAGGIGITLTRSSTVVFIDLNWSHSINRQAEDRLHRIGQLNAVQVIHIRSRNTIDITRERQIAMKWDMVRQLIGDK